VTLPRDRPLRVLHVTTVPGSMLSYLTGLVGFLRERGVECVGVSSPGDMLQRLAHQEGMQVSAVEMPRRISPLADLRALWKLWREVRRLRPDVVHAHTPKGGLLGTLAGRLAGVPVVIYHLRGLPFLTETGRRRALLRFTERVSCRAAHRVICVSRSNRAIVVDEGLCPEHRITVLGEGSGQGVDARHRFDPARYPTARAEIRARLGIPDDAFVAGFVGRLAHDKGLTELGLAWRRLRAMHDDMHLVLVGGVDERDAARSHLLETFQVDPRVHSIGFDWEVARFYAAMDVVILPTYREGFPNVLLEAAAMERAIVATRVSGCVDAVIDGETGTLVPAQDAEAIVEAVVAYHAQPGMRARHGAAARERVMRHFQRETVWANLLTEYRRLVAALR
jgi:glycosyltransferase involved in cell wall biosynthesis